MWIRLPACSRMASTTRGWQWPVATTAMPGLKSRKRPLEAAQVVMEATAVAKKDVNEYGLVYISGQGASSDGPLDPVLPLAPQSLAHLATAVKAAGSEPGDVARVTCFLSSLDRYAEVRRLVESSYSGAALNLVQVQRAPARAV